MKRVIPFLLIFLMMLPACSKDDYSPDIHQPSLLPDQADYLDKDYGTQALAREMAGTYPGSIGIVIYDEETRTKPELYLTRGYTDITLTPLKSGALEISYKDFQTVLMPLKMDVTIKALLEKDKDSVFLRGTDGIVRTALGEDMPIGTPLPESDDAELTGVYVPADKEIGLLIDLMLPMAVKALVSIKLDG